MLCFHVITTISLFYSGGSSKIRKVTTQSFLAHCWTWHYSRKVAHKIGFREVNSRFPSHCRVGIDLFLLHLSWPGVCRNWVLSLFGSGCPTHVWKTPNKKELNQLISANPWHRSEYLQSTCKPLTPVRIRKNKTGHTSRVNTLQKVTCRYQTQHVTMRPSEWYSYLLSV